MACKGRPDVDWERVGREFCAGEDTLADIAARHGVSDTAIRKRAEKHGWVRDLSVQVRAKARAKVIGKATPADRAAHKQKLTERETIEFAATECADVILGHQKMCGEIHAARNWLMESFMAWQSSMSDQPMGLTEMSSAANMLDRIIRLDAQIVRHERQAYNIEAEAIPDDEAGGITQIIRTIVHPVRAED